MKNLLILISLFLLSFPLFGDNHKGETLYGWGEKPDYKWMGFGDKENHPMYQGQVKDGKPDGLGIMTKPNGQKYVGEFKDGKFHGQGTLKDKDIEPEEVELELPVVDDDYVLGEDFDAHATTKFTTDFVEGQKYVGGWKNGKKHGQGTFTWSHGEEYVGEFKDGEFHGQGTLTFPDGSKYVGESKNGFHWNTNYYDKNGNIISKYVNGKEIKQ